MIDKLVNLETLNLNEEATLEWVSLGVLSRLVSLYELYIVKLEHLSYSTLSELES